MFGQDVEQKRSKISPGMMLEMSRSKRSCRFYFSFETEIRQRISSLIAKYKKCGIVKTEEEKIQLPYREQT